MDVEVGVAETVKPSFLSNSITRGLQKQLVPLKTASESLL
jgi:hypothetical protein